MYAIALDGPSGAGKSTVAKDLADVLNITYIDTGAMYRALGLKALRAGISTQDQHAVAALCVDTRVSLAHDSRGLRVYLDDRDVTDSIRTPDVSMAASDVSKVPTVRDHMVFLQREMAARGSVVMDGRDIGTNVLKDARFKFYLTASPETRAHRRVLDLRARGDHSAFEDVLADIIARDEQDSSRAYVPLKPAPDAEIIDTTDLSRASVVAYILQQVEGAL